MLTSINDSKINDIIRQARRPSTRQVSVDGRKITIPTPFPSPADWRDCWIYSLLIDRFCNPQHPPKHKPWNGIHHRYQGGTFAGVQAQLGYLQNLGVGAIWLSPVLKNCQYHDDTYHGYGIQDFVNIEPRLTSDPDRARRDPEFAEGELRGLVDEAHARGIYVIFDIVLNHTGDVFAYEEHGGMAPWRKTPYRIAWRDEHGEPRPEWEKPPRDAHPDAAVMPIELRNNLFFRRRGLGDENIGDFYFFKELVTDYFEIDPFYGANYPVRETLTRAYQYLIARYDIDGFRIDSLKMIEPDFALGFGNAVREFAYSIGKKEFFTFGEVYDNEEKIARYIGRNATETSDLIGVDAALDFPLYFRLPPVVKGLVSPLEIARMYTLRHRLQNGIISSHGEAGKFFVTFLDNHDMRQRFHFVDPAHQHQYEDQLALAVGSLFTLQGIPCLYYGTEQGLHGRGNVAEAVREALWGKADAFDPSHPFYKLIQQISNIRSAHPALRYGRQYFRQVSSDGMIFAISNTPQGILAYSRLLSDEEILVVANTSPQNPWQGEVIVDYDQCAQTMTFDLLFSNHSAPDSVQVNEKNQEGVLIYDSPGIARGPARTIGLFLQPMEFRIYKNRSCF